MTKNTEQIDEQSVIANSPREEETSNYLRDDEIRDIVDTLRNQDTDTVNAALEELSPVDTADLISKVSEDDRRELLEMYSENFDPESFTEMDPELQRTTLSSLPAQQVADIISAVESDDALELISSLDEDFQKEIMRKLSAKMRLAMQEGLSFPEDSAGRLMQREIVAVPDFWTAGKTIDYLRSASSELPERFFDIFVVSPAYHIVGEVPLSKLIRSKRSAKLEELTLDGTHIIPANMDQEEVADIFRRDNVISAPVADENGRLLGVITIDDIIDVIDEEAGEDILALAGVDQSDLYRAVWATTGTRFRWLFVNLLTAILASVVISFFGATIEQIVALAILMPIVASMGGNAGTQALTVAVRALATKEISETNTLRVIWKEVLVGTLNGAIFALIAGIMAGLWFASPMLGLVIALAMIINLIVAGFCGAGIPIMLERRGADPAVSSAVFLTTVTDVVGFFAFLGLAALLLTP